MASRVCSALALAAMLLLAVQPAQCASGRKLLQGEPVPISDTTEQTPVEGSESAAAAQAINEFGDALFEILASQANPAEGGGQIISPFSIAQALGMLLNGVEPGSDSAEQIRSLLGGALPLNEINVALGALTDELLQPNEEVGLRISNANSAWIKDSYTWQEAYQAALQTYFNATLEQLSTAQAVNDWVSEATRGKITEIVNDDIVQQAVLMLVNAVYFKGQWANQFDKEATKGETFNLADGKTLQAAMMAQKFDQGRLQYQVLEGAAMDGVPIQCPAVRLPYNGFTYSAIVSMPAGNLTVDNGQVALETEVGAIPYAEALNACRQAVSASLSPSMAGGNWPAADSPVNLYLPRFEIEFSANLNEALQALNVTAPFVPGDLTQMAEMDGQPATDLAVSDVIHKTYEKVDEFGVEAAAVTAVIVGKAALPADIPPIDLRFDRPFVFDIVHDATGLALFIGDIYKPEEWTA
ncbi:ase inhibitor I4 serpin isoform A [Chlorella sorokiniana]|uniref:Ase inhibitor I4 serpin isoform A n=1 Tax=Chlorella sorokiniana TaxID=3076 RepID=A0A2P6TN60_CHLSO|nr:ase inhibitor I4 serpin isoform A [Chlorella sorokiniana]|eukprot:PRW50775.1 ase inhibitor I4 serpin isoform A [Chlorella sorokiniana]